jgi:polyisoprenoid-binding protein YceI
VPGSFTKFTGTLTLDRDNLEKSTVTASIEIGSINTASDMRDNDLRGASYFDATKYPTMTFTSTAWKKGADKDSYEISGNLTLHGVTKPVVLKAKLLGFADGMSPGSKVTGWEATAALKRKDFGIVGGVGADTFLGDDVAVTINIEADLKK